jgi:hypothetical protein
VSFVNQFKHSTCTLPHLQTLNIKGRERLHCVRAQYFLHNQPVK